jgi:hypothetical protein
MRAPLVKGKSNSTSEMSNATVDTASKVSSGRMPGSRRMLIIRLVSAR